MAKEDWNADEFRYQIRYRLDEPEADWHEFEVEDPLQNRVIIRDQPTFRKYLVQVRAVNSVGPSILEPQTLIGYSGEDGNATLRKIKVHRFSLNESILSCFSTGPCSIWPRSGASQCDCCQIYLGPCSITFSKWTLQGIQGSVRSS